MPIPYQRVSSLHNPTSGSTTPTASDSNSDEHSSDKLSTMELLNFDLSSTKFVKLPSKGAPSTALLPLIKKAEKHTFPTSEVFDFDAELAKRTTNLYCLYSDYDPNSAGLDNKFKKNSKSNKSGSGSSSIHPTLWGYVVFLRSKALTRIHKVCVVEELRGKGVGMYMMEKVLQELRKGGAGRVDLWVDEERGQARKLYSRCGFVDMEREEGYYGTGRTGIRMKLEFSDQQ